MSLGSGRKFNGGQSVERQRKTKKKERRTGSSCFPRQQWRRRWFRPFQLRSFEMHLRLQTVHAARRIYTSSRYSCCSSERLATVTVAPFCDIPFSPPAPPFVAPPLRVTFAWCSTLPREGKNTAGRAMTLKHQRPGARLAGAPSPFPRGRFFFPRDRYSIATRVKREVIVWNRKKMKRQEGRNETEWIDFYDFLGRNAVKRWGICLILHSICNNR